MDPKDKKKQEDKLDEEIEDSFPASDPPSTTPVTGIGGDKRMEDIASHRDRLREKPGDRDKERKESGADQ